MMGGGTPRPYSLGTMVQVIHRGLRTLRAHWPEYLIEAWGLGTFMLSACVFATLIEHPGSPVRGLAGDPLLRRIGIGLAMGLTAVGIIYSPWGGRSGAHLNPALTFTFYRLGKIDRVDAVFYGVFQFLGAWPVSGSLPGCSRRSVILLCDTS